MNTSSGKYEFITHDLNNAAFNIASEEYLLEHSEGCYVYLWRNRSAVIVGVNQNTLGEVDLDYTSNNDIEVIRRISGGGAVYHDLGNICFTVIGPYNDKSNNIEIFTRPVIEFLNSLGICAEFTGRNDITVNGLKISGMAQCVKKGRIMHHGTLLFDTDMSILGSALKPSPLKLKAKGIQSVRKRVVNLREIMEQDMTADDFFSKFRVYMSKNLERREFTSADIDKINGLVENKFGKYEWNVGKSPKAEFTKSARLSFGTVELSFNVIEGKIRNANIYGDFFTNGDITSVSAKLDGVKPVREEVSKALSGVENVILGASAEEITEKLFFGE